VDPTGHNPAVVGAAVYFYAVKVSTSPDTQQDLQFISMDVAEGNYFAAGLDAFGAAIPGATGVGKAGTKIYGEAKTAAHSLIERTGSLFKSKAKGVGFKSFTELKSYLGSPGKGKEWHHIVEQCQIQKSGFNPSAIHNTNNIIAVDEKINKQINGYYSSKRDFAEGKTVRDWLAGQSYETQYQFGLGVLKRFGVNK
jgi:hypothetical protein